LSTEFVKLVLLAIVLGPAPGLDPDKYLDGKFSLSSTHIVDHIFYCWFERDGCVNSYSEFPDNKSRPHEPSGFAAM
jgi:hypothetical protein